MVTIYYTYRLWLLLLLFCLPLPLSHCFFRDLSHLLTPQINRQQMNYGVAVTDVDLDGQFDFVVAGFNGPNSIISYDRSTQTYRNLADQSEFNPLSDPEGAAIGVCACDIDGDGREEIYVLNTNLAYAGRAMCRDRLFKYVDRDRRIIDLLDQPINEMVTGVEFAGRSVACLDRKGTGVYSVVVANYADKGVGKVAVIEMDRILDDGQIVLRNVAKEVGLERAIGGRGLVIGPILGNGGLQDVFFVNEGHPKVENSGDNAMMMNRGDGTFTDVTERVGLLDAENSGRGVVLIDFNEDGWLDIAYGNYWGPHRLYLYDPKQKTFFDVADPEFADRQPIRTLLAADFDNDGSTELYMNNMIDHFKTVPNRLFRISLNASLGVDIQLLHPGYALESQLHGTGGAYGDVDGDGLLELILSHGEDVNEPLTMYKYHDDDVSNDVSRRQRRWIRVLPLTLNGAPARGAIVNLTFSADDNQQHRSQMRVIDNGSGYLGQMEPVAHFGLGFQYRPVSFSVRWPDGAVMTSGDGQLTENDVNRLHTVKYPIESLEIDKKITISKTDRSEL